MAKEKLSKAEKQLKKLKKHYDEASEELGLEGKGVNEQIQILVNTCDVLQGEICKMSDDIKINDLGKIQELTPIDKKTYLDFVNICALKNNGKLKEKAVAKFTDDFYRRLFITNIRHSFLESYMSDKDLKITDEDNEEYSPYEDYKSEEFNDIMQNSATKREYLNNVLWKQYKHYAAAAEYITNLELKYSDFKNLVDWQHYANGGYPTPNSPSKIWAIFDKFNYAHRLLTKYGYENTINELNDEFGLEINETTPNPKNHPWDNIDDENI